MQYEINVFEGNNFAYKAVANEAGTVFERVPSKYSDENGPITSYIDKSLIDPQIQALREAKTKALSTLEQAK